LPFPFPLWAPAPVAVAVRRRFPGAVVAIEERLRPERAGWRPNGGRLRETGACSNIR